MVDGHYHGNMQTAVLNGRRKFELIDIERIESASRAIVQRVFGAAVAADDLVQNEDNPAAATPKNVKFKTENGKSIDGIDTMAVRMVEIGHYKTGCVFGLGEQMEDRVIMAKTRVQCLLIPRYWLLQHEQNIGNIWQK